MNIKQMQYEFQIQMNQFNEALQLDSDDIQYWLNKAQIDLVKEKYNGANKLGRGFEQSQQRIDDLRLLVIRDFKLESFDHSSFSYLENFEVETGRFPNNYLFLISSRSEIAYNYPEIEWIKNDATEEREAIAPFKQKISRNRLILQDQLYNLLEDPFNTTKPSAPLCVIANDRINVFSNKTFIVEDIIIDYLREPKEMNIKEGIDCELPSHVHKDIIQRAVDLFLNNTRELKQRLQRETPTANKQQNEEQ